MLERFDIKKAVMGDLDRICRPEAILATNTSSISVTRIASTSKLPGRVIGMHFFNPVPMMALVEIIRALQTTDETTATIVALTEAIGKKARVSKDSYGFVVNRVLVPMINEAINCVYEGLATPEDVDQMMKLGANHPMGPLSLADLIGLDIVLDIMETLYNGFDDFEIPPEPALEADVRRQLSRPQDRQGVFHLRGGGVGTPARSGKGARRRTGARACRNGGAVEARRRTVGHTFIHNSSCAEPGRNVWALAAISF